jgi:bifunctional pyridoxal-dependent enzyme with beta-cystathionase and maltose regulon repressor activities
MLSSVKKLIFIIDYFLGLIDPLLFGLIDPLLLGFINRDLLGRFCRDDAPGLVMPTMEATYLALLDFRPLGITEPATLLEKEAALYLSDGRFFGSPGHARLNFGCTRARLHEALAAIRSVLASRP